MARLRALYLLTYADSRATGPKAFNDWTARLQAELFDKAMNILESGSLFPPHAVQKMLRTRDRVRSLAERANLSRERVEAWLEHMPPRYTLTVTAEDIVWHLGLVVELEAALEDEARRLSPERAGRGVAVLASRPAEDGAWEVVFAARDQTGLFATVAGVLSLHGLNIFAADAFSWRDGTALSVFRVSEPPDPLYAHEFWSRVRGALKYALLGKLSLDYRLDKQRGSPLANQAQTPGMDLSVRVNVDNAVTDFYTVIEVQAPDRLGLLYEIAHTLQMLRVDIHHSRVVTHGARAMDVFYVRDVHGQKVEDDVQAREIREALLHRLTRT